MILIASSMQHRGSLVSTSSVLALLACACPASPAATTDTTETTTTAATSATTTGTSSTGTSTSTGADTSTGTPASTGTTGETTTGGPAAMTIYDVQQGKFPQESVVTIKGVVVTSPIHLASGRGTVFVEEAAGGEYSGIALDLDPSVAALDLELADAHVGHGDHGVLDLDQHALVVLGEGAVGADVGRGDDRRLGDRGGVDDGEVAGGRDRDLAVAVELGVGAGEVEDAAGREVEGGARVSDWFLFDLQQTPKPTMGQVYASITGPLLFDDKQFLLVPRSLDDLDDGSGDTTGDTTTGDTTTGDTTTGDTSTTTGTSTTGEPPVGIYAVQQGIYNLGDLVVLEGVIATSGPTLNKKGFFVQEPDGGPFSGIFIFNTKDQFNVSAGDVLTIAGTYTEFNGLSELSVPGAANVTKTGTAPVPAPVLVTSAEVATGGLKSEDYEGVLLQIQNAKVTAPVDGANEFIVDTVLRIDDLFFAPANWPKPQIGDAYTSIVGPLTFTNNNFKLVPRSAIDLVK